ncbi:MAG: type II toxin-antitoxin system HipA family toxin YjjJ [Bdellovibrionales bacterium]|nr:type II toxin-antitoxin system HipA family toxin YjjJ [Bdellovibrionales bacterium]
MARPPSSLPQDLEALLRSRGPLSGQEIASALEISQPTLSRHLRGISAVARIDTGRPPLYALTREFRGLGSTIPLFKIDNTGKSISIGSLTPIHPRGFIFHGAGRQAVHAGVPYFLSDNRPQGFLGKSFVTRNRDLNLPPRIQDWGDDDIMEAVCRRGDDCTGNVLAGRESFERFQRTRLEPQKHPRHEDLHGLYIQAANQSLWQGHPGSSVAGEQPKFSCSYKAGGHVTHVLVKFSPRLDSPVNQRWGDLLISEHIALTVLGENGIASGKSRILKEDDRIFLEIERFDRVGEQGRIGLISLEALDDELWGRRDSWFAASFRMQRSRLIHENDARRIRLASAFGDLMGNTDQHFGNLSLYFDPPGKVLGLAPAYDILPMLYAPVNNELVRRDFRVASPNADDVAAWENALPLAREFWRRLSENAMVSESFRIIAAENCRLLRETG